MVYILNIFIGQPRNRYKIVCIIEDLIYTFDDISFPIQFPSTYEQLLTQYGGTTAGIILARILNRLEE